WFFDFADVFVFISGSVCGLAYYRTLRDGTLLDAHVKAGKRALQLVVSNAAVAAACVAMLLLFLQLFGGHETLAPLFGVHLDEMAAGWCLHWLHPHSLPYLADVLWLYAFLLLM